ncbi:hypothetical protein KB206_06885 [Microvirga sp. STS02]|uniref:hypothetical protein n=1 Tax=Hymenobacter negativus TaxID=2795026 RepID=UPI0018DB749F|nr:MULTISPECIES: hypothetical protein [Bacteria]MBH8568599.1 hypothetical protein [Hymenobacter negativus]MBR7208333.1 hypothetical protein [Microvirga sp. STS02]
MTNTETTTAITTSYLLSESDFDQYAAEWKVFAGQPGGTPLTDAFFTSNDTRLLTLTIPLERIQWLVSAVGVRQIRARFLLMPGSARKQFNLALFATDATGYRLSAYYLPEQYYAAGTPDTKVYEPIPDDLASVWQQKWQAAAEITTDMFTTYTRDTHESAVLEGYNFEIKDFVSVLFETGQNITLGLGLHQYHAPTATSEEQLTSTFGLVLQAPALGQAARGAGAARVDFDMAFPCPPGT